MTVKPIPIQANQWDEQKNSTALVWQGYYKSLESAYGPADSKYIIKTTDSGLPNAQVLASLATGFVKVATTTGTLSSTGNSTIQASDLANTAVAAGSYTVNGSAIFTVDAQGRLTSATSPTINIDVVNGGTGQTSLTANNVILGNGTSAVQFVAPSTSGNVLTSNGTTWTSAAASGGAAAGQVIQVVSTAKTDTFSMSSATYADVTGLSVAITPASSSNKVLVICQLAFSNDGTNGGSYQLVRDSTAIDIGDAAGSRTQATAGWFNATDNFSTLCIAYFDSPATTSATTYKVQIRRNAAVGTMYINRSGGDTDNAAWFRGASTITALEVKG